jgi:hypothetical protein
VPPLSQVREAVRRKTALTPQDRIANQKLLRYTLHSSGSSTIRRPCRTGLRANEMIDHSTWPQRCGGLRDWSDLALTSSFQPL